ncbi:MAG: PAS domain-containing protein, partial [Chloroflexota bacterium]|nr:PAS domain-containing protein [Chloroflexota bacterium]
RQVERLALDRLSSDQPLVRGQLEALRLLDLRVAILVANDPGVVSALNAHDGAGLDKLLGRLRSQALPAAQFLVVVDAKGRAVSTEPYTELQLANDAPVKSALRGTREANLPGSRNSSVLVRSAFPQLSTESAWPVLSQGKAVGAVVAINPVTDETLNLLLRPTGLQAAVILPRQGVVLAATTELRRLSTQRRLPRSLFDPNQTAPISLRSGQGAATLYVRSEALPSQPVPARLLLSVPGADVEAAAAGVRLRIAAVAAIAVTALSLLAFLALALLLRPLRSLQSDARALVEQTGLQLAPAELGPRDVALVAGTLKRMAASLAEVREAQQRDRGRVEDIIDSMADGVVVSDAHRRVTYVNPVAKRLLGINGVQPGQSLTSELIPAPGGNKFALELAGSANIIKSRSAPIIGENGQTTGYVTILHDASQEAELDRLKSDFVAVVSHELRTPLTSIKGSVDLLLEEDTGELNTTQRRFLSTIRRSSDRLINLVNDLLDLSRLEAGRVQLDCHPVDARHLVEDAIGSVGNLCAAKKQSMRTSVSSDLPPLFADRHRMEQVLV